jgi:hypothetical protein
MYNLKTIAATLAVLGSGSLTLTGCDKDKAATENPGAAAGEHGEASCSANKAEGSCSADKAEGSCSADKAEGSCSADKTEGADKAEGSCSADKKAEGSCGGAP